MRRGYRRLFTTLTASTGTLSFAFSPQPRGLSLRPFKSSLCSSSTSTGYEKLCIGGDFAGFMARFSPVDGSLIPVPEHLIPASLIEWGQEPSSLEVLVSEEWDPVRRQELTVLPETGCAIDNLETMKSEMVAEKGIILQWSQPSESTLILDTATLKDELQLETQFSLPDSHRIRLGMNLKTDDASHEILSPITFYLERQTDKTSTGGTRADGGGLDGRTVSQLLGEWLRKSSSFAEKKYSPGEWNAVDPDGSAFSPSRTIHLPGNITISSGSDQDGSWHLETSHFSAEEGSRKGSRRILKRKFNGQNCEVNYSEEDGEYIS